MKSRQHGWGSEKHWLTEAGPAAVQESSNNRLRHLLKLWPSFERNFQGLGLIDLFLCCWDDGVGFHVGCSAHRCTRSNTVPGRSQPRGQHCLKLANSCVYHKPQTQSPKLLFLGGWGRRGSWTALQLCSGAIPGSFTQGVTCGSAWRTTHGTPN